jgi:hypothetical protein
MARAIRCPYLAIHGIDPGPAYATWLAGLVPGAVVEVWDGLGHYPHLVEPDRFVRRIEEFWRGTETRRSIGQLTKKNTTPPGTLVWSAFGSKPMKLPSNKSAAVTA